MKDEFMLATIKAQSANLAETLRVRFAAVITKYPEVPEGALIDLLNLAIDVYSEGVTDGSNFCKDMLGIVIGEKR